MTKQQKRTIEREFYRYKANKEAGGEFIKDYAYSRIAVNYESDRVCGSGLNTVEDGVVNAVSKLKDSKAKSKVVILLTDGTNNMGDISPLTAADIAKSLGIRIYTIGVGTNGMAPYPMATAGGIQYMNVPVEIDEKTLRTIAETTGGSYYRATSTEKLQDVYRQIDRLERTKMRVNSYSKREEAFLPFALLLVAVLILESLLRLTLLRRIP